MIARTARLVSLLLGVVLAPLAAGAETLEARRVVDELHGALLGVMKQAKALGYEGRYARLEPVLLDSFDVPFMAQKSIGRHWKDLSEADQQRLESTFGRFMVANYAGRFDGWSGQRFETLGEEPSTHETLIVRTRLVDPEGEDVQLNYRLRLLDGKWRIIDVYLDGTVSELALRRSENSSLMAREGFEALLTALDGRIAELAAGQGSDAES